MGKLKAGAIVAGKYLKKKSGPAAKEVAKWMTLGTASGIAGAHAYDKLKVAGRKRRKK